MSTEEPPLVTIVTPNYNGARYLEATLESVQAQTYPRIEHIVVDGGSCDGSRQILERYEGRLRWISEPDRGQSDAINKGWRMSAGEILTWLNADDLLAAPDVIARVVARLEASPEVDVLVGDFDVIDPCGRHLFRRKQAPFSGQVLRYANNFITPSAFFRRSLLEGIGDLDVDLRRVMDLEFWLRALDRGARFRTYPGPMWKHRFHSTSSTVGSAESMKREFDEIQRRYQARWLRKGGVSQAAARHFYGATLRAWTQAAKLLTRGHLDNLLYSYYVRHWGVFACPDVNGPGARSPV